MIENAKIAPFINEIFTVTSEFWEEPRNHRGLDISTGVNSNVYSMCTGSIILNSFDKSGYGYYIIIKDSSTNMGFLFAHLKEQSNKNVGDNINIGDIVGIEGSTGESTGIHLHVEMQDLTNHDWIFKADKDVYINPADFMGISNVEGNQAIYNGHTPVVNFKKNNFKWVLYANKIRNRSQDN